MAIPRPEPSRKLNEEPPKILSMDDAEKLAKYNGLVNKVIGLSLDVEKLRTVLNDLYHSVDDFDRTTDDRVSLEDVRLVLEATKPNN